MEGAETELSVTPPPKKRKVEVKFTPPRPSYPETSAVQERERRRLLADLWHALELANQYETDSEAETLVLGQQQG